VDFREAEKHGGMEAWRYKGMGQGARGKKQPAIY